LIKIERDSWRKLMCVWILAGCTHSTCVNSESENLVSSLTLDVLQEI
jgi:hypothetical protein